MLLKASQTVRFLETFKNCVSFKKRWGFREKILKIFVKMLKVANLPQVDWNSRITRKFGFWKNRWFFRKRNLIFWKQLNLANLMSTATETVSQFDVECERNSEISRNVQELAFFSKKWVFRKKFEIFKNRWW